MTIMDGKVKATGGVLCTDNDQDEPTQAVGRSPYAFCDAGEITGGGYRLWLGMGVPIADIVEAVSMPGVDLTLLGRLVRVIEISTSLVARPRPGRFLH
jgi:hypothetical protein